jgi:hypothetical protein
VHWLSSDLYGIVKAGDISDFPTFVVVIFVVNLGMYFIFYIIMKKVCSLMPSIGLKTGF